MWLGHYRVLTPRLYVRSHTCSRLTLGLAKVGYWLRRQAREHGTMMTEVRLVARWPSLPSCREAPVPWASGELMGSNYSEVLWCTTRHLWSDLHTYFWKPHDFRILTMGIKRLNL
jgi:hypothetical protein